MNEKDLLIQKLMDRIAALERLVEQQASRIAGKKVKTKVVVNLAIQAIHLNKFKHPIKWLMQLRVKSKPKDGHEKRKMNLLAN